jgi:hypothetical protein
VKSDFLLVSLIKRFPNEVDNIGLKDMSFYQDVKNIFLNQYSASSNGDLANHMFGNQKNQKSQKGTTPSSSGYSKPSPSSTKNAASTSLIKIYT